MKLYEHSVEEYINKVDSKSATPGGGTTSAITAAMGIGLIRMVGHLTMPKKKFKALSDEVRADYISRMEKLEEYKSLALVLAEEDSLAFDVIMDALKLPKETEAEVKIRREKLDEGTILATVKPYEIAELALKAMKLSLPTLEYAIKGALSDFGVGMLLLMSGLKGAVLNVKTNMHDYHDKALAKDFYQKISKLEAAAEIIYEEANKYVTRYFRYTE